MIKADQLREFRPTVRYQSGDGITLTTLQDAIMDTADKMGIPVAFNNEQVKSGGLFNSTTEDCLVLYHPEHQNNYFKFCVRIKRQGAYAFVMINDFGQSKQMAKVNTAEFMKADRKGKDLGYKVASHIGQSIRSVGANKQKLEDENNYYQCIYDIFDEIVS